MSAGSLSAHGTAETADCRRRHGRPRFSGAGRGPGMDVARRGKRSVFVGTKRGMEARLVPEAGFPLETIRSAGLKGIGGLGSRATPPSLRRRCGIRLRFCAGINLCAALGVGGYAAGPMMLAAMLRRLPTVVFEPNAEPGFTNRVLARMATRIATGYERPTKLWGKQSRADRNSRAAGIFRDPCARARGAISFADHRRQPGGAGDQSRRGRMPPIYWPRTRNRISIVHQTGERDYNAVRVAYARREINAEVLPFI